jgi:acyl-CoA synthetase (AMP-forming)/AMP-acid ligase II
MRPDNLGYLFDAPLTLAPDSPALFQDDVVLSYADLDARANRMANALRDLGIGAGDRVALMFSNDFRFLESLVGPMRLGAVSVPLNTRMGDEALRYVMENAEAQVVIANTAMAARATAVAAGIPRVKHVIADGDPPDGALAYEPLLAAASPVLARRRTDPGEISMQLYTSGSTGRP